MEMAIQPSKSLSVKAPPSAAASSSSSCLILKKDTLDNFQPSKVYTKEHLKEAGNITSLGYDDRGEFLLSSGDGDTLHLWNCITGRLDKKIYSKKYGCDLARFTHENSSIIYASTKMDNTIRYQAIEDNRYIDYFRGHESRVTSLEMCPIDKTFLSAAKNESVRLWDLRSKNCQGLFPIQGHPIIAIDPDGIIFATALNEKSCILLYDLRNFINKPFLYIYFNDQPFHAQFSFPPRIPIITSLSFSPSGILILVGTAGNVHYVIDSHSGNPLYRLRGLDGFEKAALPDGASLGMVPEAGISGQECGWTPDGRFVYSGSADNKILFWHIPDYKAPVGDASTSPPLMSSLFPVSTLLGHPSSSPPRAVRFNPRHAMFATASDQVALWLPDLDEIIY